MSPIRNRLRNYIEGHEDLKKVAALIRSEAAGRICGTCENFLEIASCCLVHEAMRFDGPNATIGPLQILTPQAPACASWNEVNYKWE